MSDTSNVLSIRETMEDESKAAEEELRSAFYDLCGFAMKELKTARKYLSTVEEPWKVKEETLVKVAEAFLDRARRYAAAKARMKESSKILRPDAPTVLRSGLS